MAEFDLIVKDGMVIDGRRNPRFRADVGVKDGTIAEIGNLRPSDAKRVLDARGLNVAPGFIDLHTHYDSQLFWDPYCSTSGWHGVTSLVIGNCGFGFAPVAPEMRDRAMLSVSRNEAVPLASMQAGMPWDWVTFPEFLSSVERTAKSVNILPYVPLTPLLMWVMGLERAKAGELPTDAEHQEMCRLLDEAMDAGACGFSAQRLGPSSGQRDYDGTPMPTDIMHDETIFALAGVLKQRNEGFIQYTIGLSAGLAGTADVTTVQSHIEQVAMAASRPVIIGIGPGSEETLAWVRRCRERGIRIYTQGATRGTPPAFVNSIADGFNVWDFASLAWCDATVGSTDEILDKLADPDVRRALKADADKVGRALGGDIGNWVLYRGTTPDTEKYNEQPLSDIAEQLGKDVVDTWCDINIADRLESEFFIRSMTAVVDTRALRAVLDDPYVIPGISDGGAHTKYSTGGHYPTEYLAKVVREHAWQSLEEAHWRLSALAGFCAGFRNRGVLAEGAPADMVVYDYGQLAVLPDEKLYDYPGGEWRRAHRAHGYRYVTVNGQVTIEDDQQTDVASGQLLRHGGS